MILFNRVVLKTVLLKDRHGDTLLYSPSMVASLKKLNTRQKRIGLSRLRLLGATLRLSIDTAGVNNLRFIVDALKPPADSARTQKWKVRFEDILLENSSFVLENHFSPLSVPQGINFTDLRAGDLNLNIRRLAVDNDTVSFYVEHLSAREKSGFRADHLEAQVMLSREFFLWRDVKINTPSSSITANRIDFRFRQWQDFGKGGIMDKIRLYFSFEPSTFNFEDLAYFTRFFGGLDESAQISGDLRGRINSFKGDDIILQYGENSRFHGSFDLQGLPDFQETYMYFNIEDLRTSVADIESIQKPGQSGETIEFSETLSELGNISYRGKFAGFYNDFVTYGSFITDLGNISSDLSIRPDSEENVHFRGDLKMEGFDLGKLADLEEKAGRLSMEANVEGISYQGGELGARMDGKISLLEFNGYPYRNMIIAGDLSNRKFDGSFSITDPNLKMEFFGKIDFTDTVPVFDFTANVDKAMLYPLNISSSDPNYRLSCYLRANFIGANPNDFDGEITLVNSLFQKQDKQIQIYDFNLLAHHRPDTSRMILKSDLVDAEISGNYEFEDLGQATRHLLAHHLPSFKNLVRDSTETAESQNNFRYSVNFKNTFPITDFFIPEIEIARNSRLQGNYFPAGHEFTLYADFPGIQWKETQYTGLELQFVSNDSLVQLESTGEMFESGSRIHLENLSLDAYAVNDRFGFSVNWDNKNPYQLSMGTLSGQADFQFREKHSLPRMDIRIDPGEVIIRDTAWHLSTSNIIIDSSQIRFSPCLIAHGDQTLEIEGQISEDPEDRLNLFFRNLNLAHLNQALNNMNFSGTLNGSSTFSGVYDNPVFLADLQIDSLAVNRELLGNTSLKANWINPEEKIQVELLALRGRLNTLHVTGNYFPDGQRLDFKLHLDKLKLNIFQPYLANLFSNLEGQASGDISLGGTVQRPLMNGEVNLLKTSFLMDYLQTSYSLSDRVNIRNNDFLFSNIEVFDELASRAVLNGRITTRYLREPRFDLYLDANNFRLLKTREVNNQLYYGDAYGTGRLGLEGSLEELKLVITARTEKGTHIFIPINQGQDIKENNFITFVSSGTEEAVEEPGESYPRNPGHITLDCQLEVTEDAVTEIIFDPQVGDILTGRGQGNIQLSIDPQEGFQMFGQYTIESGEYFFTLQNIINKKLKIDRGGTITWNGDPTSALINIKAIYNAKAAPGVLIPNPPEHLKKRMPVECHLNMEGNLLSPLISFDIVLPAAEEETRNVVRNAINTDEELTKQFISLLVINNFSSVSTLNGENSGIAGAGMAGVTASELLSSQLSNWLSQISNDFDIGVNYRRGDELTSDQVEVALSTQIFDDRVSIHTNVDVSAGNDAPAVGQKTSTIAGDFDVEVKLTDNGRFRLKAYNRYNHDQLYKTSPYTQGVGFVYREDFNNFGELGKRYSDAITGKNRRKKRSPGKTGEKDNTSDSGN